MKLEVLILSKNLEIADLNDQLKSPPIILPSCKPHDLDPLLTRQDNETESVEKFSVSNDSQKNSIKASRRRSRRLTVDNDSEFETDETHKSSTPIKGARIKEFEERLVTSSRRSPKIVDDSDSEFETDDAYRSSKTIKGAKGKEFEQRRASVGNHLSRSRSFKENTEKESNFSLCDLSSENIDREREVTEIMAIDEEGKRDREFSDESMVLQEGPVQRIFGKVGIKHILYSFIG
jgi:hypothetical protein